MVIEDKNETWLEDENYAYPNGGQTRMGRALFADGTIRRVWAGIPDTYFSIPAHARVKGRYVAGWLTKEPEGDWIFNPYQRYWTICKPWSLDTEGRYVT